ncbi:protein ZAR1-like isoform X2 [Anolis sagrei]|uniref:protein ZAR1-like isoform X2 n=1 Tax=Anolis sagrei TaxID=38937 RepID=UPI003520AF6E
MERFVYPPYGIYQGYGVPLAASSHNAAPRSLHPQPPSKQNQPNWKQNKGGGSSHIPPPAPSEPLEAYKRAQLKALLSQANPRPRRANTKEAGVQVNPRVDAAVQCSLGPQPLCSPLFACPEEGEAKTQRQGEGGGGEEAAAAEEKEKEKEKEEEEKEQQPGKGDELPKGEGEAAGKGGDAEGRSKTTFQVYFKQLCRKCQKSFNPYKVEAIQCHICSKTRCSCPQKKRHIDLKRPHRQELCGRCKGKRLSCDNTYSFKYII